MSWLLIGWCGGLLLIICILVVSVRGANKLSPFEQALETLQKEHVLDYAYQFAWENSAIYIYSDLKKIGLVEGINAKVYDIGSVREYSFSLIDPHQYSTLGRTEVIGGGLAGAAHNIGSSIGDGIATAVTNRQAKKEAQQKSGLFIRVKDIDHPQWRIEMYDMNEQIKWNEILTQLFEGTLGK